MVESGHCARGCRGNSDRAWFYRQNARTRWARELGQKRRVVYDTGHNIPRPELIRESLEWLDKYRDKPLE